MSLLFDWIYFGQSFYVSSVQVIVSKPILKESEGDNSPLAAVLEMCLKNKNPGRVGGNRASHLF